MISRPWRKPGAVELLDVEEGLAATHQPGPVVEPAAAQLQADEHTGVGGRGSNPTTTTPRRPHRRDGPRRRQRTASRSGRLGGRGPLSQSRLDRCALAGGRQQQPSSPRSPTTHKIGVTQVVTDGPEGNVTYHLRLGDGTASFGAGPADAEDVRIEQSWATATAVATGDLNAQEAFIKGLIRLTGNQQKLIESQPVFAALDAVFTSVREQTEYR